MKTYALTLAVALAAALAPIQARAVNWTYMGKNHEGSQYYVDSHVTKAERAAVTLVRVDYADGTIYKHFAYASLDECRRGFGVLRTSDLGGGPITKLAAFTLGDKVSVADHVAAYLCDSFDY